MRRALATPGPLGQAQHFALLLVLMIGVHSQLEYPLWYAYFLLPAAWAWGFALQGGPGDALPAGPAPGRLPVLAMAVACALLVAGAAHAIVDYRRVVVIFAPGTSALPLDDRIAAGQRSVYFAHHGDYASITSNVPQ